VFTTGMALVMQDRWLHLSLHDSRKRLAVEIWTAFRSDASRLRHSLRGRLSSGVRV